jgi:hypothetical protein
LRTRGQNQMKNLFFISISGEKYRLDDKWFYDKKLQYLHLSRFLVQ